MHDPPVALQPPSPEVETAAADSGRKRVPQSQVVPLVMPGAVEVGGGSPEGALGVALVPDLVQRAMRVAGLGRPAFGGFVEEDEGVQEPDH